MDENSTDFSVVLFRPNFMPVSEEHPLRKRININGFEPTLPTLSPLRSHEPGHTPEGLGCRRLRSDLIGTIPRDVGLGS